LLPPTHQPAILEGFPAKNSAAIVWLNVGETWVLIDKISAKALILLGKSGSMSK
jgi:hypothetical protein